MLTLRNKGCVHPHLIRFIPEFAPGSIGRAYTYSGPFRVRADIWTTTLGIPPSNPDPVPVTCWTTNMTSKIYLENIKKGIKKRRISRWFQIRWKSFKKVYKKKVISKNVTENCTFCTFTHVRQTCFAYSFSLVHFLKTFSTDWKSAWNSVFFDTFMIKKNFFFRSYYYFFKLWSQMLKKRGAKNQKTYEVNVSKI